MCGSRVFDRLVKGDKSAEIAYQQVTSARVSDHGRRMALGLLPGEEVSVEVWMVELVNHEARDKSSMCYDDY